MSGLVSFTVKWRGESFELPSLDPSASLGDLKDLIFTITDVAPYRQKLLGLTKSALAKLDDANLLGGLDIKLNKDGVCCLTMMGCPESEAAPLSASSSSASSSAGGGKGEVLNDLSLEYGPGTKIYHQLTKHSAACEIHFMQPPRPGKKLLVLDLDHTLLDFSSKDATLTAEKMKRPHLNHFLSACYKDYDISIWSQTSWRWLEVKLVELGLANHADFKICFCLDKTTMFRASEAHDLYVKPLALIFTKSPPGVSWGPHNTLHVDDLIRNFELNKNSGVLIRKWSRAPSVSAAAAAAATATAAASSNSTSVLASEKARPEDDVELALLARYLGSCAKLPDVSAKDHSSWRDEVLSDLKAAAAAAAAAEQKPPP